MTAAVAPITTLICHSIRPAERQPALLRAFDALAPGQSFELQSNHPQKPALARLSGERKGLFEWSPLEEGPTLWRTLVTRRAAGTLLREVSEALGWDHDRLDELERQAFAARAAGDTELAVRLFKDFERGLRRHIAFEEELLFPTFERGSEVPAESGPTRVMRQEHREIERLLTELEERFGSRTCSLDGSRAVFHEILRDHNRKEELVLYPLTDRLLTPDQRDELVSKIQAFKA